MTTIRSASSAKQISEQLGERLKQARLNRNITQEHMARQIGVSRRTVINAEKGQVTLENLVAILQVLGLVSQLDSFLPAQPLSPVQLMKLQGTRRQRASGQGEDEETGEGIKEEPAW